ncbi:hypothetical protein AYX14_07099 [Cryptococcus neoformans]|nr:hypothetical protein AYX14_07099 [Cryptococcus neoformans var. grubii]
MMDWMMLEKLEERPDGSEEKRELPITRLKLFESIASVQPDPISNLVNDLWAQSVSHCVRGCSRKWWAFKNASRKAL